MRISQLAQLTGASTKALRLYESKNLLPPVPRAGNYRDYQDIHLEQVLLIRKAQSLGFKLKELEAIQPDAEGFNWPQLLVLLKHKHQLIQQQLAQLQSTAHSLSEIISELESCPELVSHLEDCPTPN